MKRRSRTGGEPVKTRRRRAATLKRRNSSKTARRRGSSAAVKETEIDRLRRELNEALEQQTATSEVLGAISRSKFELQPILQSVVDTAARLCRAEQAVIYRPEGKVYRFAAGYSVKPAYLEIERQTAILLGHGTVVGRAAMTRQVARIDDAWTDPLYEKKEDAKIGGVRSMIGVPLMRDDEPIGIIALARCRIEPFTDHQIELVATFANQAVIAIENTRLLNELRELLQQQTATADVLKVISRSPGELEPVFQVMLENATRICEAKFGTLYLSENDGFRATTMHNAPPAYEEARAGLVHPPPDTSLWRAAKTKQVVQTADVTLERSYIERDPFVVTAVAFGGYRGVLGVPMLHEDKLIGVICIFRQEVRPFTDKQIELVQNFAAQAVIAIENTRLLNELRQRTDDLSKSLEQQTATSEVLQVISGSPGDLQPVFASMLENAVRICDAKFGNIHRWDGDALHLMATHNTPPAFAEFRRRSLWRPDPTTAVGRTIATKTVVQIADIATEQAYIEQHNPSYVAAVELGGIRTLLAVPMLKENELIGVFTVYRQEVRPFTDKQISFVSNFAAQAVIAIENTRLLNELRQRTDNLSERTAELTESLEQQTATAEVLQVISGSPGNLAPVFEAIVKSAVRMCEARYGAVFRLDEGGLLHLVAHYNFEGEQLELLKATYPMKPDPGHISGRAIFTGAAVQIPDILADENYRSARGKRSGFRSLLAAPLLRGGRAVGAVVIYRIDPGPFAPKHLALLDTFASQAVIAIENTELLTELRQRTDELGRSIVELRALGEVSQAVNSTLDFETVLSTIVAKAVQLSGTDAGAIYVFNNLQREFHLRATYGMDQELIDALARQHIGLDEPNVELAFAQGEPIQVADLREDAPSAANEIVLRAGYRARLVAPLLRGEDVVGMLVVRRRTPGAFPQNTVDLIKTFAAQSVLAIQNARLFENVEARTGELAKSLEDLRTAQDRLVQTEKLASLGQLTAGIAHEIKNPLNFVNNFSAVSVELIDELREALGGAHLDSKLRAEIAGIADMLQGNLDKVVQHGKRADAIVKNMLLHSRQGSGEHRPVDINALVEESLNLAYHGARAEKQGFTITLERSFDPTAGEADLFPQEITRALLNLISNGFYAATKRKAEANGGNYEPTLTATTKNLGDSIEIRIRDNGTGIPPEVKEKLFSPFFTTKPAGEGTGLGLSISHDIIVKQHGGSIEVDTQPDEFAEFRIVLPRAGAPLMKSGGRA